jgi:AF2212-like/PIN domain
MDSIPAIYDAGVFRPLGPVNLAEGTRATVTPLSNCGISPGQPANWPTSYFDHTAGALEGEAFDRPAQGDLPQREGW